MGIKGRAKPLSQDHKPQLEGEPATRCSPGRLRNVEWTDMKSLPQLRSPASRPLVALSTLAASTATSPSLAPSETSNSRRAPNSHPRPRSSPPSPMSKSTSSPTTMSSLSLPATVCSGPYAHLFFCLVADTQAQVSGTARARKQSSSLSDAASPPSRSWTRFART